MVRLSSQFSRVVQTRTQMNIYEQCLHLSKQNSTFFCDVSLLLIIITSMSRSISPNNKSKQVEVFWKLVVTKIWDDNDLALIGWKYGKYVALLEQVKQTFLTKRLHFTKKFVVFHVFCCCP